MTQKRKGPKPRHTREEMLEVALGIVDSEGLAGLNLRLLADRLDLTPMAIYRSFSDKEALLAAMVAQAFPRAEPEVVPVQEWRQQVAELLRRLFEGFVRHPGALELILARVESEDEFDRLRAELAGALRDAGFRPSTVVAGISLLISQLLGVVALEAVRRRDGYSADVEWGPLEAFEFGLERNLAALEVLLTAEEG